MNITERTNKDEIISTAVEAIDYYKRKSEQMQLAVKLLSVACICLFAF